MDRTLVRVDTATLYVRYQRDVGEATWRDSARLAWWLLQYGVGVLDAPRIAKKALSSYVGKRESWMIDTCEEWFGQYVLEHVCEAGRRAVARHQDRGEIVAVVTSATPYAVRPLARELGIEHICCSELEVADDGRFTGEIIDPLCYGEGKIERTQRLASELDFEIRDSVFYTDSITDRPLLERVGERVCVNPDGRLRRLARRRGWRVERW